MSDTVRAEKIAREVDDAARQLAQAGRLDLMHEFIQHGDVTVYTHVTSVARASLSFAERLGRVGISVDRLSLLRGALLHDYFLYDWHDPDPSHRLHGFRHPFFALARAEEDFELTPRERNIIVRHMFPLVPVPPTCREAWIVCLADKWCALRETIAGRLPRKGGANDLNEGPSDPARAKNRTKRGVGRRWEPRSTWHLTARRLPPVRSRRWYSRLPSTVFAAGYGSRQSAPCSTTDALPTAAFC